MASPNLPAQTLTALHIFSTLHAGVNTDGSAPRSGLALSDGVLYGSVPNGNTNGFGAIYSVNPDGSGFTVLHLFVAPDGLHPEGDMVLSDGTLYGTANSGGTNGTGTVFSLGTNGTSFTVLHTFATNAVAGGTSLTNADGSGPIAGLILSGNTLYGTASGGGTNGNGTVFSVNTNGSDFTVLHTFRPYGPGGPTNADGANPQADLLLADGTLYGTTRNGGTNTYGTLFAVRVPNGSGFTVLHTFDSHNVNGTNLDGWYPEGSLVISGDTLFGTASNGGTNSSGTVFSVKTNGTGFNILYSFSHLQAATNSDGARPDATVVLSGNNLYGTAQFGGTGNGVVFWSGHFAGHHQPQSRGKQCRPQRGERSGGRKLCRVNQHGFGNFLVPMDAGGDQPDDERRRFHHHCNQRDYSRRATTVLHSANAISEGCKSSALACTQGASIKSMRR